MKVLFSKHLLREGLGGEKIWTKANTKRDRDKESEEIGRRKWRGKRAKNGGE